MIPEFPEFKKIELSDRGEIEMLVNSAMLPPYADFYFVNMWIWNTNDSMMISKLNGNLVIVFSDYMSGDLFLSFIGKNNLQNNASELIKFSKENYNTSYLKLIPEEIAKVLQVSGFAVEEDRDSHDYVYLVSSLVNMDKWSDSSKAKNIKRFIENHPEYKIKSAKLADAPIEEIKNLFKKWRENKGGDVQSEINESKALDRLFQLNDDNIGFVLLYINGVLIGFTMHEILSEKAYAISRFAKADISFDSSVYDILNWEEAKILEQAGIKYYNWEQDLGIEGLRYSKMKYRPAFFLKQFTVSA